MKSNCRGNINFHRPVWHLLCLILLAGGLIGCASDSGHTNFHPVATEGSQSRLRGGDQITIRVDTGSQGSQAFEAVIDENGEISLPLINRVKAAGLSASELAERIQASYVPRYYVHVAVIVLPTARFFYMGGEVRSPGRVNWTEDMTLMKAIQTGGGFTDFANRRKVEIVRGTKKLIYNAEEIRQHPEKDIPLQPGDSLYVPRSIF